MFAKIEQRTAPFPPDWSQAPPQRLFAFIRYYCRGFYAPLVIIMLAGIGVAVLEVLLFGFIGHIVNWLGARSPDTLLQEEGWRLAGMALVVLVLLPLCNLVGTVARNQMIMGNMPMAVRWRMHNYLLGQSLSFYQDEFSGRVSAKVMQTALAVRAVATSCMDVMVYVVAYFFSIIALMASQHWAMLLLMLAWLAAYATIISHFLPRSNLIAKRHYHKKEGLTRSAYWANELPELTARTDLWIYGHSHDNINTYIDGTRFASNQRGYSKAYDGSELRDYNREYYILL